MASLRTALRLKPFRPRLTTRAVTHAARTYTAAAAAVSHVETSKETPFFPQEPSAPIVKTQIPGPKAQAAIKELDEVFDTRSLNMIANYHQSFGNYISDPDGNVLLDV